jgi:hypothetical protein
MADILEKEPTRGSAAGEFWHSRFDRALRFRQNHWNGDKAWKKFLNLYKGNHWQAQTENSDEIDSDNVRDRITVNITGSTVLNLVPFLIRQRPQFMIQPRKPVDTVSAALQETILNYVWKEMNMQPQARKIALDSVIIGHGIGKTGFNLEIDESLDKNVDTIEYRDYIRREEPFVQRVSPFLFVFDPEAPEQNLESARWCAEIFFKPLQDIITNDRYSPSVRRKIKNGDVSPGTVSSVMKEADSEDLTFQEDQDSGDLTRIVCFELWDKRSRKYYVFAHGVHEPLIERDWPFEYLEGFPYEMYDFIPVPEEPYALGLPSWIEDQQYELNRTRTSMFQHRRRFNRKYTALEGMIEDGELTKLEEGEDGTVVVVKEHNAVLPIQDAKLSGDQYQIEQVIKQDIRELTGSDELARGGNLPSRTTATEIQTRSRLLGLKLEDRVEGWDTFIEKVGRKVLQHIKANYITDKVIKIAGIQGSFWVSYTPADIQGEFDMTLDSTSGEQTDPLVDRQQAIQIMQIMLNAAPILMQTQVPVNWAELFKWVFKKFGSIKDIQRFFPPAGAVDQPIDQTIPQAAPGAAPGTNNAAPPPGSAQAPIPAQEAGNVLGAQPTMNSQALGSLFGGLQ